MSKYILPILIFIIVLYSFIKKNNAYESFMNGCKEGINIGLSIFPSLIAIIFSSRILISSGFIDYILKLITPVLNLIKFPIEVFPMALLRPISGNASLVYMTEIFTKYGPDSFLGLLSSTLQGCTDTTLYILTLYFGSIGIKKIRYSLYVGLLADLIGIISSVIIVRLVFNF